MINIAKISMSVYFECKMIRNINALQVSNGKSLVMVNNVEETSYSTFNKSYIYLQFGKFT